MRTFKWTRKDVAIAVSAGVGAAIAKELQKPREERTWKGKIFGLVSYDLSPATVRNLPRRGALAIRAVKKRGGGKLLTTCPNCGTEFDHEAHQVEMPDPSIDATQSTASVTRARCPQCGTPVDLSGIALHTKLRARRSV